MLTKRIVPCLDVNHGRVVKGVKFQGLQDVDDPVELAKFYSDAGADELVFYDITASNEQREIFLDVVEKNSVQCIHTGHSRRRHTNDRRLQQSPPRRRGQGISEFCSSKGSEPHNRCRS